jgi:hypothetical protein
MTSTLRSYARPTNPTKFFDILTPGYYDNTILGGFEMPIPFTVVNQVLDINTAQSSDVEGFVNNGDSPSNAVNFQCKAIGGARVVSSFGPKMLTWLRKRIENQESPGVPYDGPLLLTVQPLMTKIQLAAPEQGDGPLNDESVYGITDAAPSSSEYIGGDENSEYYTAWVFKTPMTIRYRGSTGFKYMTMTTQFSAN